MTPKEEQALRMKLTFALSLAGTTAQMFSSRDPALGLTIQKACADVTGKHWEEYKSFYEAMKSGGRQAVAAPAVTCDEETVIQALSDMGIVIT